MGISQMNIKAISRNVGMALLVSAVFMFISAGVSYFNDMDSAMTPLLISGIITFIVGQFPLIFVRERADISMSEGFVTIVLSWLLSFVFGMLPYVMWGGEFSLINAWFESASGYTTTGGTILTDVEALPDGLLFWRSSTHFIGGLGIIAFLLLIMPKSYANKLKLTNIEISSLAKQGYRSRPVKAINIMFIVYVGLVVTEVICLVLAGMPLFDSVNHAFSTVATGGFAIKNSSIAYYDSSLIDIIIIVFMLLSSLNLGVIFSAVQSRSLRPLNNPVVKFFLLSFVVLSLVVGLNLIFTGTYTNWGKAFLDGTFQVASQISTTGFAIADNNLWPPLACIILLYASFQCGCSGSTNGGVKSDRMLIMFKAIGLQMKRTLHPSYVMELRVGEDHVKDSRVQQVVIFICFYIAILLLSFVLLLLSGVDVAEAFSGPLTCMSNSGPGMGQIGTMGNYSALPAFAKFVLTIDMLVGRVEIYPFFLFFATFFRRDY